MTPVAQPLVSVITVVYNGAKHIRQTIESVITQDYPALEYIIIDGGSSDGTVDIIAEYSDRIAFWSSEKDKGIYDAMNKGIDRAKGTWINFMNCGDRFASRTSVTSMMAAGASDADILYGDAIIIYPSFQAQFPKLPIATLWRSTPFCHQASFSKTTLMKEMKFDTTFRIGSDHDFFYRAYRANKKFEYIAHTVCLFDGREGATNNYLIIGIREKFRSALRDDFSVAKWLYATVYIFYIRLNLLAKKIVGKRLTQTLAQAVKQTKQTGN